jgi:hypothetical protein
MTAHHRLALRVLLALGLLAVLLGCARPDSDRSALAIVVAPERGTGPVPAAGLSPEPVEGFSVDERLDALAKRHFTDAAVLDRSAMAFENRRGDRVIFGLVLVDREAEWRAQRAADGTLERELAAVQRQLDRCLETCEEIECNACAPNVPHGQRAYFARISARKDRDPTLDVYIPLAESDERIDFESLVLTDVDRDRRREIVLEYGVADPPDCTYEIVHAQLAIVDADSLDGAISIDVGDSGHGGDGYPDRFAIRAFRDEDGDGDLDLVVRIAGILPYDCGERRENGWPIGTRVDASELDWDREDCHFSVERRVYLYDASADRYEGASAAVPVTVD